jgi:hypothetical protein
VRRLTGLYPVFAREQNELVRVVATRIEWDGTMQRRMVDTAHCSGGPQWEDLAARALAVPPPYRPLPGGLVYHVGLDDGTVVLVAGRDLCGLLLDLVTAVLAMGEAVLARWRSGAPGFACATIPNTHPSLQVRAVGDRARECRRGERLRDPFGQQWMMSQQLAGRRVWCRRSRRRRPSWRKGQNRRRWKTIQVPSSTTLR